jgi:hypothetical protein
MNDTSFGHVVGQPLTRAVMREQITLLNNIWPKFKLSPDDFNRLVEGYGTALHEFDAECVAGAVNMAIKKEPRFPTPSRIREYAIEWRNRNKGIPAAITNQGQSDGTCRVCHAPSRWAWVTVTDRMTGEVRDVQRCIMPCDFSVHPMGSMLVPYPENFSRWATADE